jgi:hypothetical protein
MMTEPDRGMNRAAGGDVGMFFGHVFPEVRQ